MHFSRDRARLAVLVTSLSVVAVGLSSAVLAGGDDSSRSMSRPLRPADAKSDVHDLAGRPLPMEGSQTGTAHEEHHVDWGDYVVVDAIDGQELTVHTTRDPRGHDTSPYRVLVTPDTIVDRSDPAYGGTVIAGVYDGVKPGDRFYFVGNALTQGPRFVQAVRIFPFDS